MKGKFISFEGPEGAGKSTQARILCDNLNNLGFESVTTREPGGTKVAEKIRDILVTGSIDKLSAKAEILLHYAARVEHVEKFIKPNLRKNINVICDRFIDSTTAYQVYAHGLNLSDAESIRKIILGDFLPDITFIMDICPENGLKRTNLRTNGENRYEKMGLEFHKKVYNGYKEIYQNNQSRCHLIDSNHNIENISKNIHEILTAMQKQH